MDFNPGEVVQLKSGGPLMTVEKVGKTAMLDEDAVWCTWFETTRGKQELKRDTFAPIVLEKARRGIGSVGLVRG